MNITLPNDFTPRPYQQRYFDYFDRGGKRAVWVVHRRAGKDLAALHQLCKMAHERVGLHWHMLPSFSQARRAIWGGFRSDGKPIIRNVFPDAIVKSRNEQEMKIELKCGSVVQLVGSDNYDSLVGSNPIGVTFSEFALNKPSAWEYIRPMLAENGGWASFVSTPRGFNHLFRQYQIAKADPSWFCERLTIYDTQALPASILDQERAAGMPDALVRQEYLCDFSAALVGSVWGDLLEEVEKRGGMTDFQAGTDEVFAVFDLGMADSTAIWWVRFTDTGAEMLDHYEAHGKPISHYCDELERRDYKLLKIWLPHDARAHTLASGVSVLEQMIARFGAGKVSIAPRLALLDGIQAGRWLLQQSGTRFHPKCEKGIEALRAYSYDYDEDKKTYSNKPAHDWSSHTADAFRYAAVVAKMSGVYRPRPETKTVKPLVRPLNSYTLDELWAAHESRPQARRIA